MADMLVQKLLRRIDAIFDFSVLILSKETLFLPFVCFLADMPELRRDDIPPFSAPPVAEVAIQEFSLRPHMVLRQCLGVGLQLICRNWLASFPIECAPRRGNTAPPTCWLNALGFAVHSICIGLPFRNRRKSLSQNNFCLIRRPDAQVV